MNPPPIILIHGPESFIADRELASVEAAIGRETDLSLNRQLFEANVTGASEVVRDASTLPFLGSKRLVIVKDAHLWKTDDWELLAQYAIKPNPSTCLMVFATSLDKRRKAVKAFMSAAKSVPCEKVRERELMGWAKRFAVEAGLDVDSATLHALTMRIEPDLQLLFREIQKLAAFAGPDGSVDREAMESLVGASKTTNVFEMCDAIGNKRLGTAMRRMRMLADMGEPPVRLLYMIVRHFRILWRAKDAMASGLARQKGKAAATVGVPPFALEKTFAQAKGWEVERLKAVFREFLAADLALKSGGNDEVLERLLVDLCAPRKPKHPAGGRSV